MNAKFIQTESEELISKSVEQLNGETFYITQIGKIRHRSQLRKVVDEIALELQRDEQAYNKVSEPYSRALQLMTEVDEKAMLNLFDKVVTNCTEVSESFPFMVEALRGIADGNFSLGKFNQAIDAYTHVIQLYPNMRDVHYQLGRCFFELARCDEATAAFRKEMQISGEAPDIYLQIGSIYFTLAMDSFNRLYNRGERNPKRIYSECGQLLDNAREAFEKGIKVDPSLDELRQSLQQVTKVLNSLR